MKETFEGVIAAAKIREWERQNNGRLSTIIEEWNDLQSKYCDLDPKGGYQFDEVEEGEGEEKRTVRKLRLNDDYTMEAYEAAKKEFLNELTVMVS